MKLLPFLAALAAEGRWQLHRCKNYRNEDPKNAHSDPKIIPSAPSRSNFNFSVLQSLSCAQPHALHCFSQTCAVTFSFPRAHNSKWVRQLKLLIPPLFKFAALEASSPVQIHSTLPLLPLCIKILTRNKSLNPGDLNWKLHPEVCLTPGYNLSFSQDTSCQSSSKNLLLRGRTSLGQHPNSSRAEGENLLVVPAPHKL